MKTSKTLTSVIIAALATITAANAQDQGKKGKCPQGCKRPGGPPKALLEKFDKDGDGKLNDEERAELKKQMMERREANKAKMLKRFDTDKDGNLSPEEKMAARPTIVKERMEIRQAAIKEFDKDGDGKLSPEERKGTREWIKSNYPEAIHMPPHRGRRGGKAGPLGGKRLKADRNQP